MHKEAKTANKKKAGNVSAEGQSTISPLFTSAQPDVAVKDPSVKDPSVKDEYPEEDMAVIIRKLIITVSELLSN